MTMTMTCLMGVGTVTGTAASGAEASEAGAAESFVPPASGDALGSPTVPPQPPKAKEDAAPVESAKAAKRSEFFIRGKR